MTSNKPYLIRALYEWLLDNEVTPHIMVDSTQPDLQIPPGIDKDGQVVLNIAPTAVQGLMLENTHISFSARFGGIPRDIVIPIRAVMAIYSREDGEGMMFAGETQDESVSASSDEDQQTQTDTEKSSEKKKPALKVVK